MAEAPGPAAAGLPVEAIELRSSWQPSRDRDAAHALGRALCGYRLRRARARGAKGGRQNMRKGVALLLRAADAGCTPPGWQLYCVSATIALSVANPQMARASAWRNRRWPATPRFKRSAR